MRIKQRHFIKSSEIKILKDEILNQYDQKFVESIFPKKALKIKKNYIKIIYIIL